MKIPFPRYDAALVAEIEAYLDQDYQTEIVEERELQNEGIKYQLARGYGSHGLNESRPGTRQPYNYARPMIQPIDESAFSGGAIPGTPCNACGDFSRSWACAEHPVIDWDPVYRRWKRPCTGDRSRCECDPCHARRWESARIASQYTDGGSDGLRPPQGLYDGLMRMFDQPLSPQSWRDRLNALSGFTMTFEVDPRFMEITGETVQQAGSVRIEVEADDDTTP